MADISACVRIKASAVNFHLETSTSDRSHKESAVNPKNMLHIKVAVTLSLSQRFQTDGM